MAITQRKQIQLGVTPIYHCSSRCVRQAFLCGEDFSTKKNFEHRRQWIEDRLLQLSRAYCIDIVGYSIMSNHYHVVLKINPACAEQLTTDQVLDRWSSIHHLPMPLKLQRAGLKLTEIEKQLCEKYVQRYRENLTNLSRFMGDLNEKIARMANLEDDRTGRFWEGRFHCQAVLDREALLQTLCYVELNPVRAKMAATPEESEHTSLSRRLKKHESGLVPFAGTDVSPQQAYPESIPIQFDEYLKLLDWSGRLLKSDKRGRISEQALPILERLGFTREHWSGMMKPKVRWTPRAVGSRPAIERYAETLGQRWLWRMPELI